ncbi:MAG: endonuclease/exonuclease/phosphatase family protein [Thermodesulfobacteriota bacterium]
MFKAKKSPSNLLHQNVFLPKTFSLLVWNIHKENNKKNFNDTLKKLNQEHPSNIWMFQEYQLKKKDVKSLERSYAMSCNMETFKYYYGVFTASDMCFDKVHLHLTDMRELHFISHKSTLITEHITTDGISLTLVNIHAVNFVSARAFDAELQNLYNMLLYIKGALILTGDFNNWSKNRVKSMKMFQEKLRLQKAVPESDHHIKCVFNKPLDHLFYKGLSLQKAAAIDTCNISDHNPIYAKFSIDPAD